MPNANQINYGGSMYNIDDVIKGQTVLTMYDPLKQIAYQPSIRRGADGKIAAVMPYAESSVWGLFSQLQAYLGSDKKTVNARKFYQAEYDSTGTYSFAIGKAAGAVPAAGASVTVKISRLSLSQSGLFAKPLEGYKAFIKENGRQNVIVTNVTELAAGDFNITFAPINGEILDLTRRSSYTVILSMMRSYDITSTNQIRTQGLVGNPPLLREAWVQKYEQGIEVDESEIDNYIYDKDFMIVKGLTSDGKAIDFWYAPQISKVAEEWITVNRNLKTLFNEKDYARDEEFDGLIPTIEKYGNFNFSYDAFVGASFKSLLFAMIKSIRKMSGSNEYMMLHDFNFGFDWSEAIAALVKANNQSYNFSLFGSGGSGMQENFDYFQFKDFGWSNYKFRAHQIDMFDSNKYGRVLEYFALLLPAKSTVDTDDNRVPPMTYVNIKGAEMAKDQEVWVDDARKRGERTMRVFVKDAFGCEFHAPRHMGMIWKG